MGVEAAYYYSQPQQQKRRVELHQAILTEEQLIAGLKGSVASWGSDVSLGDFSNHFSQSGYALSQESLLAGFLFLKKEQFKSAANPINFLVQVASGMVEGGQIDTENPRVQKALSETMNNILALVAEHPLAQSVRVDHRSYNWGRDEKGERQLMMNFKPFNRIYQDAIDTSQKVDVEMPRYQVNKKNYEKWRNDRLAGEKRAFVEFSPSPAEIIGRDLFDRGYRGESYISVARQNSETGAEDFTQYWLRASWSEIGNMLRTDLGMNVALLPNDVELMEQSDFMSDAATEKILAFIAKKRGVIAQNKELITAYKDGELLSYLKGQLSEVLKTGALKLLQGKSISYESDLIVTTLQWAQNKFNAHIATLGNHQIRYIVISEEEEAYYNLNPYARAAYVREKKMPLVGCGSSVTSSSDPFGLNDSRELTTESDQFGGLEFICPHEDCRKIVRRPKGDLLDNCPHCGKSVKC